MVDIYLQHYHGYYGNNHRHGDTHNYGYRVRLSNHANSDYRCSYGNHSRYGNYGTHVSYGLYGRYGRYGSYGSYGYHRRGYYPPTVYTPRVIPLEEAEPVIMDTYYQDIVRRANPIRPINDLYPDDEVYFDKMSNILSAYPCVGVPPEPSAILPTVFLGTSSNAENLRILKKNRISYILNCAGGNHVEFKRLRDVYSPEGTGVMGYEALNLEDRETFNMKDNFDRAHKFIDFARGRNGRVLIHCPGVSRSGAVAISYLIANGKTLLQATRIVKSLRRTALCNTGFMRQLISYARARGMLDSDIKITEDHHIAECSINSGKCYQRIDQFRINKASMPRIIYKAY